MNEEKEQAIKINRFLFQEEKNKMTGKLPLLGRLPSGTEEYAIINSVTNLNNYWREIIVDKRTNTRVMVTEREYRENVLRGNFGFMHNPYFGEGIFSNGGVK